MSSLHMQKKLYSSHNVILYRSYTYHYTPTLNRIIQNFFILEFIILLFRIILTLLFTFLQRDKFHPASNDAYLITAKVKRGT